MKRMQMMVLALGLVALAHGAVRAEEPQESRVRHVLGLRTWFADWEAGDIDGGNGSLYSVYYHALAGRWIGSVMVGMGNGWTIEAPSAPGGLAVPIDQRLDAVLMVSYDALNALAGERWGGYWESVEGRLGLAGHYTAYESSAGEVDFTGGAAILGLSLPVYQGERFAVKLNGLGGYYPYLIANYEAPGVFYLRNVSTYGYLAESSFSVAFRGNSALQVGYRMFVIKDGVDRSTELLFEERGVEVTAEDRFAGPFIQISLLW